MGNIPVFVYGTLKKGHGNYNRILDGMTTDIKSGFVMGELFSLGGFPGFVKSGSEKVFGELMFIDDKVYSSTLERLDRLEGYTDHSYKDNNMYNREPIKVSTKTGQEYASWIYIWNGVTNGLKKINSGNWQLEEK